jgi:uncharacterized repeat protein (TIGR01451 family)
MRLRLVVVPACLLFLVFALNANAAIRITDVGGREVAISRGPLIPRALAGKPKPPHTGANAMTTVTAGPDTDSANNDYRRIQNALNAAMSGDTITLSGTFDFTAPFAAAAWALGNDGMAATADDYEVLVPPGLSNVTLTATSLGSATIQGPGDLSAVNLEGFLIFDGGPNPGWTISNLRILDFDLSLGMFATAASDFNTTHIQNNFIRIATDLNATVAPADVNQNIGIHFSFGANQLISGNTFNIPGDGLSDGAMSNFSSTVVMQSNTSGGSVYDGLSITGNVTHVLNAQSGNPENILGIWDNGHAHTSNITISNNSFINDAAGNDPALNLERGYRVTSHSGAMSTVTYDNNSVSGANIGFQWLAATNFAGNQAVVLGNNTVTNCATGVLVQSNGIAHLRTNAITGSGAGGGVHVITGMLTGSGMNTNSLYQNYVSGGSGDGVWLEATATVPMMMTVSENHLGGNTGFGLRNETGSLILAELNYWGSNLAASVAAEVSGNVDADPWLASGTDVSVSTGFQPFIFATTTGAQTTFVGTAGADTGAALAGNPVTLQMSGQSATIPLAELLNLDIQTGGSDDVFTLGQLGMPTTFDGGAGNDTLVGTNVAQSWNITGANSGNIPGAANSFSNTESLRGGSAADSFVFSAAGSLAQALDGGLGVDSLDNSAIPAHSITPTGPGTLDGYMGTATGVGTTFDNINTFAGVPSDLSVVKSGPMTATAGTVISYTITVTNGGPNPSLNATLTDALPAGTTFSSLTSPGGWSCTTPAVNGTGTVTCSMASMPVGSAMFTLNVNAPAAPAMFSNTAVVSESNTDPTPGNDSSTAMTNVVFTADLAVVKTATPAANAGSNVTYNISLTNNGPSQATSVSLSDALPANTTFVSAMQNSGPAFALMAPSVGANGTVTFTIASFANAATATFTIVANVSPSAPAGMLSNTANVTTTATDPVPANNSSTASTVITVANADLAITKTAGPPPYGTGMPLTYTIAVSNAGPATAASVVVTDVLPAGTTFVSATPSQGTCMGTTTVTCSLGTINNGGSATISLVVTMPAAPGPLANTATVTSANPDPNPANNSSTSNVTVIPAAAIPTLSALSLLFMGLAMAMVGFLVRK